MKTSVCFACLLILLPLALVPAGQAALLQKEPEFLGKNFAAWQKVLHESKDAKARKRAIIGVVETGSSKAAATALAKAFREDSDAEVRASAARSTGSVIHRANEKAREERKEPPPFAAVREDLLTALEKDTAGTVRQAAAEALGTIGPDDKATLYLSRALKDKDPGTVRAAATTLRRFGKEARDARTELIALLADKTAEIETRTEAVLALTVIGPNADDVLKTYKEIVAEPKYTLRFRRATVDAIGKLGKDGADAAALLGDLVPRAKDDEEEGRLELRLAAATALDQMGPAAKAGIPGLVKGVGDTDRFVACMSMHALGKMGGEIRDHRKPAVQALLKAARDANVEVAISALDTLGTLSSDGLGPEVDTVLKGLADLLRIEGRQVVKDAAENARTKIRPEKAKDKD